MTRLDADGIELIGLSELSATAIRARLLEAHDRFWDIDTRGLHHPVWFHQFGGFGALGTRLAERFDEVALSVDARAVQAVTRPDNAAAVAFHTALGASAHLSRDHAGPGNDRVVLTRSLPRG